MKNTDSLINRRFPSENSHLVNKKLSVKLWADQLDLTPFVCLQKNKLAEEKNMRKFTVKSILVTATLCVSLIVTGGHCSSYPDLCSNR